MALATPVVLVIFNRPEETSMVLESIRAARPRSLFVISDGPRPHVSDDATKVLACRELISSIDWPCDVELNYSEENMGCRARIVSGLSWVFTKADRAIILEDDCLPSEDFFEFCESLLTKFENNYSVGSISGWNSFPDQNEDTSDYYFSIYPRPWGWATWRRTWEIYEESICDDGQFLASKEFSGKTNSMASRRFWQMLSEQIARKSLDTWDVQLLFSFWRNNLVSVVPRLNLVRNIGFASTATHTKDPNTWYARVPASRLRMPLVHPKDFLVNKSKDKETEHREFRAGLLQFLIFRVARFVEPLKRLLIARKNR
jgi:hypothetical protein